MMVKVPVTVFKPQSEDRALSCLGLCESWGEWQAVGPVPQFREEVIWRPAGRGELLTWSLLLSISCFVELACSALLVHGV